MKLNELRDNPGARTPRTRVGRGIGSGKGKTAGRGQKGQKSRSGVAVKGFEGGQMPLHMRVPKRGFNNNFAKDFAQTNIGKVQAAIDSGKIARGTLIDHATLVAAGIARKSRDGVRILGDGRVSTRLRFKVAHVTRGAREAIEGAGGSIEIIEVIPAAEKAAAKKYTTNPRDSARHRGRARDTVSKKDDIAKGAPAISFNRETRALRLLSVGELMSLRQELALGAAGRNEDTVGVIAQVYAALQAANGVRSMEEHPDYDDDRAIMSNALLADLHQQLMSRDKRAARAAAIAMVAICAPTEAGLSTLPLEGPIAQDRAALAARHLARILFDAGDRSYTTFDIDRRRSVPTGVEYEGVYLVSRVLPVALDSAVVVLPIDHEIPAHADEIRVFVDGSKGDPDISPVGADLTGEDVVIARRVRFTLSKARAKKPVLVSFEVPQIVTETRKLLAQDLALTA